VSDPGDTGDTGDVTGDVEEDDSGITVTTLSASLDDAGTRLDAFIAAHTPLSRSRVQALIEDARVTVDARPAGKGSEKLRGGEAVVLSEPAPVSVELIAEALPLDVLFEDAHLLVIHKAAGMAVHPGAGIPSGTVANAVLHRCPGITIGGELRPGIVHRLDKDTSGVLVVCKSDAAQQAMARAFAERRVDKHYSAYCLGRPREDSFELITGHRRGGVDRRKFTTKLPPPTLEGGAGGVRRAHSRFTLIESRDGASALDVEILTGRTHQIRAHLSDIGHPLLQDDLYGGSNADKRVKPGPVRDAVLALHRHALHARTIAFDHPVKKGTQLRFEAPLPPDLARLDAAIRGVGA
jgi:23S rRNA pseudouridine1911/1915/1917 synthase